MVSKDESGVVPNTDSSNNQINEKQTDLSYPSDAVDQPPGPDKQASGWDSTQTGTEYPSSGWENPASVSGMETNDQTPPKDPREGVPEWKWKGTMVLLCLIGAVYGYDVSNMANIQAPVYEAMGHIELLPFAVLAYSMANFAVVLLLRKMTAIFDLRYIMILAIITFTVGSIVCGAAPTMKAIIIGRIITGFGTCAAYQLCMSYAALFGRPQEVPMIMGFIGMSYSIGIISGPVIGGAFAENHNATWRWAFYINAPYAAMLFAIYFFVLPSYTAPSNVPVLTRMARIDWVGVLLHVVSVVLFPIALTFGGVVWEWDSGSTIAVWVVWGLAVISYVAQQYFCLFTTVEDRLFPGYLLKNRTVMLTALASSTVVMAHPVALYYLPLFYAFTRGHDALASAVRLLPYICVCIAASLISGAALRKIGRYSLFFLFSGALFLVGGVLMTRIDEFTPESTVMGYSALVGFGVGLTLPHAFTIANAVLTRIDHRFDAAALMVIAQLGTTSETLAISGAVFQNVGFRFLQDAVRESGTTKSFSDEEIRGALSGVISSLFHSGDAKLAALAIHAVTDIIRRLFYMIVAAGALCMLTSLFMGWEKLDFGVAPKKTADTESEPV